MGGSSYILRFPEFSRKDSAMYAVTYWRDEQIKRNSKRPSDGEIDTFKTGLRIKVEQYITARSYLSEQRKRQLRELTVYVGMAKEEVRLLVEEPVEITRDLARMAELARNYWSEFNNQITEAWVYKAYVWESTYALYFRDDVLMAVTEFYWELL